MKEFSKIDKLEQKYYYYSKEGYIIFTADYHLDRGYCCNNNCKHCPYKTNEKTNKNDKFQAINYSRNS